MLWSVSSGIIQKYLILNSCFVILSEHCDWLESGGEQEYRVKQTNRGVLGLESPVDRSLLAKSTFVTHRRTHAGSSNPPPRRSEFIISSGGSKHLRQDHTIQISYKTSHTAASPRVTISQQKETTSRIIGGHCNARIIVALNRGCRRVMASQALCRP